MRVAIPGAEYSGTFHPFHNTVSRDSEAYGLRIIVLAPSEGTLASASGDIRPAILHEIAASCCTAVLATRVLALSYDWIEFTYNRDWQRWEEGGFFSGV